MERGVEGASAGVGYFACMSTDIHYHTGYKQENILERHRHRYEFNNKYKNLLEENGMIFSGINEKSNLVEIIELPNLKHFIACQFHPEFKSRPTRPHPLFDSFIKASLN